MPFLSCPTTHLLYVTSTLKEKAVYLEISGEKIKSYSFLLRPRFFIFFWQGNRYIFLLLALIVGDGENMGD